MMNIPEHFRLPFSEGSSWYEDFLLKYSSKLPRKEALQVSARLYKDIQRVSKEIELRGLPSNLYLAHVHPKVNTGVFLKPDAKPIPAGTFIGVYTGLYELVECDITEGTSYAYDVAQGVRIKKTDFKHVLNPKEPWARDTEYSIQTSAIKKGNFTRFINHSSLETNIEAIVSKLPNGRMEILLLALRAIQPGEQLFSNYGGQYWKALNIIPNDMRPNTYILTPNLKVKLANPIKPIAASHQKILLPLRNVLVNIPEEVESHPLFKAVKKQLPNISQKAKKEVDAFEEIVLEKGLPRKFSIAANQGKLKVTLKKNQDPIAKNTCIGLIAGTFSLNPSKKRSFVVAQGKKGTLSLEASEESNFLSHLPCKDTQSNLNIRFVWDDEEDYPVLLVFAARKILPGEQLVLSNFTPMEI